MKNNKSLLGLAITAAVGVVGFIINHKNAYIATAGRLLDESDAKIAELESELAAAREAQSEKKEEGTEE